MLVSLQREKGYSLWCINSEFNYNMLRYKYNLKPRNRNEVDKKVIKITLNEIIFSDNEFWMEIPVNKIKEVVYCDYKHKWILKD
jgi:hypothetical protein